MDEEFEAIKKNDTWKLALLPTCHKAIGVKKSVQGEEKC